MLSYVGILVLCIKLIFYPFCIFLLFFLYYVSCCVFDFFLYKLLFCCELNVD